MELLIILAVVIIFALLTRYDLKRENKDRQTLVSIELTLFEIRNILLKKNLRNKK